MMSGWSSRTDSIAARPGSVDAATTSSGSEQQLVRNGAPSPTRSRGACLADSLHCGVSKTGCCRCGFWVGLRLGVLMLISLTTEAIVVKFKNARGQRASRPGRLKTAGHVRNGCGKYLM
jgi:hypothetical protein